MFKWMVNLLIIISWVGLSVLLYYGAKAKIVWLSVIMAAATGLVIVVIIGIVVQNCWPPLMEKIKKRRARKKWEKQEKQEKSGE